MRVLLIEDEERMARALVRGLQAEGMDVDWEATGDAGLWRAQEGQYDVLVVDLMLPVMSGHDICKTLRQEENWTPILILTARSGERTETKSLDLGADDYLSKPFSYPVLVSRLRALSRRGGSARPNVLQVGELVLDLAGRTCRRGDQPIQLTPREFALLELLMRRAGSVLERSEILDHVWGIDFEGDPNVLDVYIRYLRRKIDEPFGVRTVETVRGTGYLVRNVDSGDSPE